jgi:hypothetical protein
VPLPILHMACTIREPGSKIPSQKGGRYWDRTSDLFRVRAEPLLGNAGECGVGSVCRVAYVCQCAGWLAESLADMNRCPSLHGCNRSYLGAGVRRTQVGFTRVRMWSARIRWARRAGSDGADGAGRRESRVRAHRCQQGLAAESRPALRRPGPR